MNILIYKSVQGGTENISLHVGIFKVITCANNVEYIVVQKMFEITME